MGGGLWLAAALLWAGASASAQKKIPTGARISAPTPVVRTVYCSASTGADTAPGTSTAPVATLTEALGRAALRGPGTRVLASAEVYLETLDLPDGVVFLGGLDPSTWRPAGRTVVQGAAPHRAVAIEHPTLVRRVDFVVSGAEPGTTDAQAPSSIALVLEDCAPGLVFRRCTFRAGRGADGQRGHDAPGPGAAGQPGQDALHADPGAPGGGASAGGSGGGGGQGAWQDGEHGVAPLGCGNGGVSPKNCGAEGRDGSFGCPGITGAPGPNGHAGAPGGALDPGAGTWLPGPGGGSGGPGLAGTGGGGGGGGSGASLDLPFVGCSAKLRGGGGGGGGGGGAPGSGGAGGSAGGASIALLLIDSSPTFRHCVFLAEGGGRGGAGGDGAPGGAGGPGGAGHFGESDGCCTSAGHGGDGGPGGHGGAGGGGGGASGGATYGLVAAGLSAPGFISGNTFAVAAGGPGGLGGWHGDGALRASPGVPGPSAELLYVPLAD